VKEVKKMKCGKQFSVTVLAFIAASVLSGVATAQIPVCFTICPTDAQPGDLITMTAYDENGDFIDLSTVATFESNFHGVGDPFYSLLKGGNSLTNIEIIDGSVVFELLEEMLSDAWMWDYFGIPGGDDASFRIVGGDGPFETVAEAIAAGGTCIDFGYVCPSDTPRPSYPANGATFVDRDVVLEWTPGDRAVTHDVHFEGVLMLEGTSNTEYDPSPDGVLDWGTTYEWEVHDINNAEPNSPYVGGPWTFTTEPFAYQLLLGQHVTDVNASSFDAGFDPSYTIDASGLDANDLHDLWNPRNANSQNNMWASQRGADTPSWLTYVFDRPYPLHEIMLWNFNRDREDQLGFGIDELKIEYATSDPNGEETTWMELKTVNLTQADGKSPVRAETFDLDGVLARQLRLVANSNHSALPPRLNQYGLSEVRMTYLPLWAHDPQPADGAEGVDVETKLSWRTGRQAAEHVVYIDTSDQFEQGAVDTVVSSADSASYAPGMLDLGETYHWYVEEVNNAAPMTIWPSPVWSFTTSDYLEVDNMESYEASVDDASIAAWGTWADGFDDPSNNGSVVGYSDGGMEREVSHEGRQSMPIRYDNRTAMRSEGSASTDDLAIGRDWTRNDVTTLVLWFYGNLDHDPGERLYVKVGTKKLYYPGDAENLARPKWTQWNITLATLGIDLSNVPSMTIGLERPVGGSGSRGILLVDSIRLYKNALVGDSIWLEAEEGALGNAWTVGPDLAASDGQFIGSLISEEDHSDEIPGAEWLATYSFDASGGDYTVSLRAQESDENSFWVRIATASSQTSEDLDGGWIAHFVDAWQAWEFNEVSIDDEPVIWTLPPGTNVVEIAKREPGVWLDAILITEVVE